MFQYWMGVATLTCIYLIAILGVSILVGFTGLFSLGHAGFMAIGAYVSALVCKNFGLPYFAAIPFGIVASMIVGGIIGRLTLRLKGDYFVIATLAIGECTKLVIENIPSITGGARGLTDIPKVTSFPIAFVILVFVVILLYNFLHSKQGRNCVAVREEELAAQSIGINTTGYKTRAFLISCALCGLAGGLLAGEIRKGTAVVHDGKTWLRRLDRAGLPLPETFGWDTMLAAYLLNPQEKSYRMKALCPDLPEDAATLCSLQAWQRVQVEADGMMPLMREVEMPLSFVLFRMEKAGFSVDTAFLRELGKKYAAEIDRRRNEVIAASGGEAFNLNSPQQLGEVLFEKMGLPHGKKTSKGYSTSAEVLEGLRWDAPDVIEPLLRYRQLAKLNGTYVEGLLPLVDAGGRVHSTFDQTATATGRISSSEPNLQNIPVRTEEGREIREAFLPREGWILLDADYSQIELRLMAHFSGDPALLEAFRNGEDIHTRTASEIFDVPKEWVTPELRSRAKAVNFGLIYGISGFGLSRNTGVSRREAAEFIEKYFRKYPGVKRFMDEFAAEGVKNGYARTLMGRRRYLPELQSPKAPVREFGKRAAMNTPVQGTAADIIKLAMVRVDKALREAGMQSRLILQVHDELLLECPPEEAEQAAGLLREAMEGAMELRVPLVAEVHQGKNWAEAK